MSIRSKLRSWARRKLIQMAMGAPQAGQARAAASKGFAGTRLVGSVEDLIALEGQDIGVSDWLLVDQPLIDAFAKLTHDEFWTHTDPARCQRESPYGQTIAHGALMQSLITFFARQIIDFSGDMPVTVNYGFNRIRYAAPALSGIRYRMHMHLNRVERSEDRVRLIWDLKMEGENAAKPCLVAEWITLTFTDLRASR